MSDDSTADPIAAEPAPPASVVLVSGGSRGLGLAIVEDLLSRGVKVATFPAVSPRR